MDQILTLDQAIKTSTQLREQDKTIVLTGGCFDILHIGHFSLLKHAKQQGDVLMVLLESDEKIKKLKGLKRPLHSQKERALMLSGIKYIDFVVLLPNIENDIQYDNLVKKIKPAILAVTKNDPRKFHKERQAKLVGAKVKEVIQYMPEKSSSAMLKILLEEN